MIDEDDEILDSYEFVAAALVEADVCWNCKQS